MVEEKGFVCIPLFLSHQHGIPVFYLVTPDLKAQLLHFLQNVRGSALNSGLVGGYAAEGAGGLYFSQHIVEVLVHVAECFL